jgi:hypothetical protein
VGKDLSLMAWIEAIYLFPQESIEELPPAPYGQLRRWAEWLRTESAAVLSAEYSELSTNLATLARDLFKLDEDWGDTLRKGSHHIWKDITAFTPSSLLRRSTATDIHSMLPATPGANHLASAPLSVVSRESGQVGKLGVLSVFPSQ